MIGSQVRALVPPAGLRPSTASSRLPRENGGLLAPALVSASGLCLGESLLLGFVSALKISVPGAGVDGSIKLGGGSQIRVKKRIAGLIYARTKALA